jgi:dolichol kinase
MSRCGRCVLRCTPTSTELGAQYVALAGALAATTVELFNPPFLDDNMTIPIASATALHFALKRCETSLLPFS